MEKLKISFGARIICGVWRLLGLKPLRSHYRWAGFFTWVMRRVLHYREDIVMANLGRSFPDTPYETLQEIRDRFYRSLGEIAVESVWMAACRGDKGRERFLRSGILSVKNPEVFNALRERSSSQIILSSHCGNWELVSTLPIITDDKGVGLDLPSDKYAIVYKSLNNKLWDDVFAYNRQAIAFDKPFDGYLESARVLRYAVAHRRANHAYLFPMDQAPYGIAKSHYVGLFMNQRTWTMNGGPELATRLGHAVVYMRYRHPERGKYWIEFVPICEDASRMAPEEIIRRYYDLLEADIREEPWNYLWTHKRWK